MNDNPSESESERTSSPDAWREVGQQFQALGLSLAAAFKSAVNDEETRRCLHQMQDGLEAMVTEVNRAVHESVESPQGQQVRTEVEKTAENLRAAGKEAVQEVRPHLLSALKQATQELEKLVERMEQKPKSEGNPGNP